MDTAVGAAVHVRVPAPVRRLLASHAVASVAMSLPWPLLLVLVWERAGQGPHADLALGLAAATRMLPYVLLSWATGRLADRFRRDRLVRVTLVARASLLAVVAVAVADGLLVVAVAAAGLAVAAGTPAYPAVAAALPGAAGDARRRATDVLVTVEVASFVVGPAIGGLLLLPATRALVPLVSVLLTLVALVLVHPVVLPRTHRRPAGAPAVSTFTAVRRSTAARRAIGVAGLLNAVGAVLLLALLPMATVWRGGGSTFGLATALLGSGAVAAPLLWRVGSSARSRGRWGLLLLVGALAVLPATPGVAWAAAPLVLAGAASVHVEAAVTETIQDAVPDGQRAGVLGLTDSVMVGAGLLGSLAAPWLSAALGPRGVLLLLAAATATALGLLVGRRRVGPGVLLGRRRVGPAAGRLPTQPGPDDDAPILRAERPAGSGRVSGPCGR